ncbi:MAG: DUF952 domain-containing protein [Bacilli bacterium]
MIIKCISKDYYELNKNKEYIGQEELDKEGFIHASTSTTFPNVVKKHFSSPETEYIVLLLDEKLIKANVKYEVGDKALNLYPHIYGLLNRSAIINAISLKEYLIKNP